MPEELPQESSSQATRQRGERSKLLPGLKEAVDVIAKLAAPGPVVVGALIANSFQRQMTGTTLLSQREQAESQLRASMFSNLIGPIIGPQKEAGIHPDRERLMVELLALNFHEHFELKPLMLRVDNRLASERPKALSREQAEKARESLRSIAHRVVDRQIASFMIVETPTTSRPSGCRVYLLTVAEKPSEDEDTGLRCQFVKQFNDAFALSSPNEEYTLNIVVRDPDWENETLKVEISAMTNSKSNERDYSDISYSFTLTAFDFPLTDNTLLPDGNRFAVVLSAVSQLLKSARIRLVWFPIDYFTPRERPLEYRHFLELVGKKTSAQYR